MLVGGVLNMRMEHYQLVNGYSNMYWGWGAEDDDMAYRCVCVRESSHGAVSSCACVCVSSHGAVSSCACV